MRKPRSAPKRIAVGTHPGMLEAEDLSRAMVSELRSLGVEQVYNGSLYDDELRQLVRARDFDALLALGGDGTMLRAGRLCGPVGLPILGINLGLFGFLMEVKEDEWRQMLPALLAGEYRLEDRMMLRVEHWREDRLLDAWHALNEVVVCRGQLVRPIHLLASLDGYKLASFVADGLIASTPTGSTAYALAAGGPILPPEQRNILIVPVAPHLSMDRAIVLEEGSRVGITVHTRHEAVLCVDGQEPVLMQDGDSVQVMRAESEATFIRFQDPGYFYKNVTMYMSQNPSIGGLE